MMHKGVMVVGEQRRGTVHPVTFEIVAWGRRLADALDVELSCVVMGHGLGNSMEEIVQRGADVVYAIDDPRFAAFLPRLHAGALAQLIEETKPEIVLSCATTTGRTLMPLVAGRLGTGLTADCTGLEIDKEERLLLQTRPAIGGNVMATIKTPVARPQMATVRPKSAIPLSRDSSRTGKIMVKDYSCDSAVLAAECFIEFVHDTSQNVNVQDAEIIVAGGKGLKSKDNFCLVHELADVLGAAVGATRDVVDLGWIGYPHQIGLSGKTVSPRLYVALGISGTVQHLAGMQSSEMIVAINNDENAQIFNVADFGIIGDVFEVVPELIDKLQKSASLRQAEVR